MGAAMKVLRWGIMGNAKIARDWLIPAIRKSQNAELAAVASRDIGRANDLADSLAENAEPPLAFGSYEALLASDAIDAVYIPLPNHLHVPWSIKALEAGKHVLCEKPLGLNSVEVKQLQDAANRFPELLVMEAFMYRFHPQWLRVQELVQSGALGRVEHVQASFTYNNTDSENVRNMPGIGGGGLMDIGCYCISAARFIFGKEPLRVAGNLDWDPDFETDRHASGMLDFGQGMATFHCSTQSYLSQMVRIIGDKGTLDVENPFFRRDGILSRLILHRNDEEESIIIGTVNHYVKQVDAFCNAALNQLAAPTPLIDALANMKVIDAVFTSASEKTWVNIAR
jgi:predicted dehydrogenase